MTVPETSTVDAAAGDPALLNRIAWSSRWSCRGKSRDYAEAALKLSGKSGRSTCRNVGLAKLTLAFQAKWRGDFDVGMSTALEAEPHLPEAEFAYQRAHLYSILAVIHYSRNRLDLAECAVQRGIDITPPGSNSDAYVDLLTTLATIQRYKGDRPRAGLTIARARELAEGAELARVEHNMARWMLADQAWVEAREHGRASLTLAKEFRNRVIEPYAYEVLGAALSALHDFDEAEACFRTALDLAVADQDTRAQCQVIQRHADLEREMGQLDRARDLYDYGRDIAKKMEYPLWEVVFSRALADVYERKGDLGAAVAEHKRAWALEDARRS